MAVTMGLSGSRREGRGGGEVLPLESQGVGMTMSVMMGSEGAEFWVTGGGKPVGPHYRPVSGALWYSGLVSG